MTGNNPYYNKISIRGNQMFVVFDTNADIVKQGFSASIIQGNQWKSLLTFLLYSLFAK